MNATLNAQPKRALKIGMIGPLDIFEQENIPLLCQGCRGETQKSLAWIQANTEFTCPTCGAVTALDIENGRGVDKLLRRLRDSLQDS